MPERSSYVAGTPCWVDVSTGDFDATIAFYTGLFGWEALRPTEPEAGGYTLFTKDGKNVAAAGPDMGGGPRVDQKVAGEPVGGIFQADDAPGWQAYFAVAAADATAAKAVELGGEIVREPADYPFGRDTLLRDPHGVFFHALRMPGE